MQFIVDNWFLILTYILGLFALFLIGKLLSAPITKVRRFILNGVLGGVFLVIFNLIGANFNVILAVNPATALTVGFLGIPGLLLLLILQYIL